MDKLFYKQMPAHDLKTLLGLKTAEELRHMCLAYANTYTPSRVKKMNKAKLVDEVFDAISNSDLLYSIIMLLQSEDWLLFRKACEAGEMMIEEDELEDYAMIIDLGLLYAFYYERRMILVVPDEVRATLREIDPNFINVCKLMQFIADRIAAASANLYGAVSIDEFLEILTHYEHQMFKEKDDEDHLSKRKKVDIIKELLLPRALSSASYTMDDDYIFSTSFLLDDDLDELNAETVNYGSIHSILEQQKGKKRYLPSKKTFLKYEDNGFFERTKQVLAVKNHLCKRDKLSAELAEGMIAEIHDAVLLDEDPNAPIKTAIEMLEQHDIAKTQDELYEFVNLIVDMANHTRIWINNGHTPDELSGKSDKTVPQHIAFGPGLLDAIKDGDIDPDELLKGANEILLPYKGMQDSFTEAVFRAKTESNRGIAMSNGKIGRNQPCPCGSGKKYKNCCGKEANH